MPILPPKEEPVLKARSVYLPEEMWDELSEIAQETKKEDRQKRGYSRNEVIMEFLKWGISEYRRERGGKVKR